MWCVCVVFVCVKYREKNKSGRVYPKLISVVMNSVV